MKASVLHKYDESLTASNWVTYEDVPDPKITKPTDVLVKIGGAGVCRTDLHVIEGQWRSRMDPDGKTLLPYIMGHENAGWVEEVGSEVFGLKKGDPVILHPRLSSGFEIEHRRGEDMHGTGTFPGVSENGGYAEALVTSVRNIVALPKSLAPKAVAAYADAGLTAYHVAKKASRTLLPGQFVVAIGAGGLGHIGIQCLKAMCAAEIIVVDMSDMALKLAKESGADHVIKADGNEVEAVMQLTKGFGAEAVIDFVGEKGSTKKGLEMTRALGNYYIVGYGENITISALDLITTERNIVGNLVGTWADLNELMSLADRGLVHLSTVEYSLKDADQALHDLNAGKVKGRAILIP
ncbi:MAG: NAD(P)-dependent alcohol dehydrogenase [Candidatus Planktophila sp.]|nr:NAD(P)-dependent alcohol dehydrogenase [Candidatus Planktophila sp.]MSO25170.1 NAD(P)-dependent alcohol dehydrogenase [Candidatus Planktophila sp.]